MATYFHIKDTDNMDGHTFEHFCAEVLRRNGYINVQVTQGSGDYGVDILAEKDSITYAIQCKCYSGKVGNKAVQEAFSGCAYYGRNVAVVMTNSYFTQQAIEMAKRTSVVLWDRTDLSKMIGGVGPGNSVGKGCGSGCLGFIIKGWILLVILAIIFRGCTSITSNSNPKDSDGVSIGEPSNEVEKPSIWATEYTPLDHFDYRIEDDHIIIERYRGTEKTVWVAPEYEVENAIYYVTELDGLVFRSVSSVILSNGITTISNNIFNGSSVQNIFIPISLEYFGDGYAFYKYLHKDGVHIYYEGTQEQWELECKSDVSDNITLHYNSFIGPNGPEAGTDEQPNENVPEIVTANEVIYKIVGGNAIVADLTDAGRNLQTISIPSKINGIPVTSIAESVFYSCENLEEIEMPDTIASIGEGAFAYCKSLKRIDIPHEVTIVENSTFLGCKSLSVVNIPNGVTSIGSSAFWACGFSSIELPETLKAIGFSAFCECENLKSITIPPNVEELNYSMFSGDIKLKTVYVPETCKIPNSRYPFLEPNIEVIRY